MVNGPGCDGRCHGGAKRARKRRSLEPLPGVPGLAGKGLPPCPAGEPTSPHPQARREGHTAVRTDDDSGFDTLWLLKKMDSRSEKQRREGARVRSSRQRRRFHHRTPGGSTTPATGRGASGLRVRPQPPGLPPSHPRDTTPWRDTRRVRAPVSFSSHINVNGLTSLPPLHSHLIPGLPDT